MTSLHLFPKLPRAFAALTLLAGLTQMACSDPNVSASDNAANGGNGTDNSKIDPKTLIIVTEVGDSARAGVAYAVKCHAYKPGETADKLGAEVSLPASATVVVTDGPAKPVTIEGVKVTLSKAGNYFVQCQIPTFSLTDLTPEPLDVIAGLPVTIDTRLVDPTQNDVVAGTPVPATCTAQDKYGNEILDGFVLQVAPLDSPQPKAFIVELKKAGDYQLGCKVDGQLDQTPALLHVHAGVPVHLFTLLDPPEIEAGSAAGVTCVANDAYGNPIADFPFSIDLLNDPAIKLTGLYLSSSKAGAHQVSCVPEQVQESKNYTLHSATLTVDPGPPSVLQVQTVPAKQVYKDSEKVQFLSAVKDAYDNVIPTATVSMSVTTPAKGYKVLPAVAGQAANTIQFNDDATYVVHLQVDQAIDIAKDINIIVDGTPPALTIDYPNWGDTLTGKPSIQVAGTAQDSGSGLANMKLTPNWDVNAIKKPVLTPKDDQGTANWTSQVPARHGLNTALVDVTDLGGETSKATRGYYWASEYYPTDGAKPKDNAVKDGIQVFLGKDFIDDGNHDPNTPNDLATIMEMALGSLDLNSLLPPNLNQSGVEVKITNLSIKKPKVQMSPIMGGLDMHIWINDFYADLQVKAKGPLGIKITVSGHMTMSQIEVHTVLGLAVTPSGGPTVKVISNNVGLKDLKLSLDGLAGLFNFIIDLVLNSYVSTIEKTMTDLLNQQIPPLLLGILNQFAINQTVPVPGLLPGGPTTSITLASWLTTLAFTPQGVTVKLDAEFSAPLGTAHKNLGSISRKPGCPGDIPDLFYTDESQRMQLALHDDLINQALYAVWYGGALKLTGLTAAALGLAGTGGTSIGGFSLDGATFDVDMFLAPILESCGQPTTMDMRVQAGDVYLKANLKLGDSPLEVGIFISADLPAHLAMGPNATTGVNELSVKLDAKNLNLMMEIIDISADFVSAKDAFESVLKTQIDAQLAKGIPGLDKIAVPLPALDLGSLLPGMSTGTKLTLTLKDLLRKGGYTTINAQIN